MISVFFDRDVSLSGMPGAGLTPGVISVACPLEWFSARLRRLRAQRRLCFVAGAPRWRLGDHGGIGRLGSGTLRRRTADQGIG